VSNGNISSLSLLLDNESSLSCNNSKISPCDVEDSSISSSNSISFNFDFPFVWEDLKERSNIKYKNNY